MGRSDGEGAASNYTHGDGAAGSKRSGLQDSVGPRLTRVPVTTAGREEQAALAQ